ncbi:MAG: glycosyltransferase family 2 protein [Acidobacteriaceae bacterium]
MPYESQTSTIAAVPLVSVAITAFHSEKFLAKAIESVLAQRTDFPVEIVIGDDCSQDRTVAIARTYRDQYPDAIRVLERARNLGIQRNYYETFEQCRGKYIAWLDADDYWTDPDKLTIQTQVLESDPSIMICCHFVRWVTGSGELKRAAYPAIAPGRYGMAQILHSCFLPSPSVVFRNGIHRDLPPWYFELAPTTDWPLYVVAARSGDIVLLDRVMADYTLNPGSSLWGKGGLTWHTTDARFYEFVESILPAKFHRMARAEKGKRYESMAYLLRKKGDFTGSRQAAVKAFRSPSIFDNLGSKTKALLAAAVREAEWRIRN